MYTAVRVDSFLTLPKPSFQLEREVGKDTRQQISKVATENPPSRPIRRPELRFLFLFVPGSIQGFVPVPTKGLQIANRQMKCAALLSRRSLSPFSEEPALTLPPAFRHPNGPLF